MMPLLAALRSTRAQNIGQLDGTIYRRWVPATVSSSRGDKAFVGRRPHRRSPDGGGTARRRAPPASATG